MACDINTSGFAQVYKLAVGVDASFVSILTGTSSNVFDFVVSNNTLYFSNGIQAKKWDPANGVSNWGIAIGSVNTAVGPNAPGTATDVVAGTAWTNPNNIKVSDGVYATVSLTGGAATSSGPLNCGTGADVSFSGKVWTNPGNIAVSGQVASVSLNAISTPTSDYLQATNFGFSVPVSATISGIVISITRSAGISGSIQDNSVRLVQAGAVVGAEKGLSTFWPLTATAQSYGSSSDLWGTTWTPAQINASNFGVAVSAANNGSGTVTATVNAFITATVYYTVPGSLAVSDLLQATNFSFALASTNTVSGILVEVQGFQTQNPNTKLSATMLKGGSTTGTTKSAVLPVSNGFVSYGGTSDLWGTTWTPNDVNQTNFGVSLQASSTNSSSTSWSVDFVRITLYGTGGPAIVVSASAGTMSATVGYEYVFCYGNSNSGHLSSPTPVSASTGVFTNKLNVQVSLTASTDAQVNQIRVFRTTDSAAAGTSGGTFFELPTSPYANTTANILDTALDTSLNALSVAPLPGFNDPPPPGFSPTYFSGRIWLFNGNKTYFSGLEEIPNGVPEESFVSGVAGNFWTFDQPVQGHGVAGIGDNQALGIFCGGRLYTITGNTLDTFRRRLVSNRRGARNRACISMLGGMCAWLDSANQVWASDGSSMQELSIPIRPDLKGINQANCSLTFHSAGNFHWLLLSTGSKILAYDIDQQQWMPPWNHATNYLFSGETSPGNYQLMSATPQKALQLSTTSFNDNGTTYTPNIRTNLFSVVPDFGRRFSYMAAGMYDEPSRTGVPWIFQVDNNGKTIADVGILTDDDPTSASASYNSITSSLKDTAVAFNRKNGQTLVQNVYETTGPSSRWVSLQIKLANADQVDNVYGFYMAYKPLGGR